MKRVRVFVSGRVQGVWFRESTRIEAEHLGVTGWVRNLADGRVEAVYEGQDHHVDELIAWTRHGPANALVDDLDIRLEDHTGNFEAFVVRR